MHFRHRYSGLRLIAARDGRCCTVPIGWRARTDHVHGLREADDVRIELTPGVQ
ncbi:hypothetical protein QCN29_23725 [Streptomyces sp. HNM0663]|uniref:Uncharacterized protein n=1 Tax=Streptomyces chengmaiensis TaxID=3040919 RepID=A0ABT6HSP4_9ACTN|nr:hypothetical protein [Streptomyces chengmaiensis]MDH2391733.1 hypothetical protein [Streptomyces chengmaiensis]